VGRKCHSNRKHRAVLVAAATLPAVAGMAGSLMSATTANGAISFSVTNQGVAHDNFGHTATGWSGFLLTFIADPGDVINGVDLGAFATLGTNGIFGHLLQNWLPTGKGPIPTPVEAATNGGDYGIDTHIVVTTGRLDAPAPFEDGDLVNPDNGVPANDSSNQYGTGSYLRAYFGVTAAAQGHSLPVAYVVLKDGTQATFSAQVSETSGEFILKGTIATVPEPGCAGIAGLMSSLLLGRRRRLSAHARCNR
jgi:hypothetical protein